MPSQRRVRLILYIVLAGVVTLLFFTSQQRQGREMDSRTIQDFYHKTMGAMNEKSPAGGGAPVDPEDERLAKEMAERLRAAEQRAKDLANAKAPNKPDKPIDIVGVGSSAGGQKKVGGVDGEEGEVETAESEEEHKAEEALDEMLKKSPVLIFSKSYCPYSKKAKGILLDKYSIDPPPYVVELDEHPLGAAIQDRLAVLTGRRTVPNIMINGKSIGGGDDISALDNQKTLIGTIKEYGGKGVTMSERFADSGKGL